MSVLLSIVLLTAGFGMFEPVYADQSASRTSVSSRAFRSYLNDDEHRSIYEWLGLARSYAGKIELSVSLDGQILSVSLTGTDEETVSWLRPQFSPRAELFWGNWDGSSSTEELISYEQKTIEDGVLIELSDSDPEMLEKIYKRLLNLLESYPPAEWFG